MASARILIQQVTITAVPCAICGGWFGVDEELRQHFVRNHTAFYCPNGHSNVYNGETAEEKAKKELAQAEKRLTWYSDRLDAERREREAAENSLRTTKGHLTRAKNRAAAGVCIHCNRTFQALAKHMQTKHAEEIK